MIEGNEIQRVYDLMQQVSTAAAAAPAVTAPMAPVTIQIVAEKVKHIKLAVARARALADALEILKKIAKIEPPDFHKHRLQDPHRQINVVANVPVPVVATPPDDNTHKTMPNIPNTTHVNPSYPKAPKTRT